MEPAAQCFEDRDGGIGWTVDDRPGRVLEAFFAGYDRAFILPDEKEDLAGFQACLGLNGCKLPFAPWPVRELVMIGQDQPGGPVLAGANFLATLIGGRIAVALNYAYVEPAARGRGLLRRVLGAVEQASRAALDRMSAPVTLFIEQNDPLRLSAEHYAADSAFSGIDQVDRLAVWARMGAKLVDLDYVQPPLSAGQQADGALVYAALRHDGPGLPGDFLAAHLTSFFGISVLKGIDPVTSREAAAQIDAVRQAGTVRLLPMEPAIAALRQDPPPADGSLIALARRLSA